MNGRCAGKKKKRKESERAEHTRVLKPGSTSNNITINTNIDITEIISINTDSNVTTNINANIKLYYITTNIIYHTTILYLYYTIIPLT